MELVCRSEFHCQYPDMYINFSVEFTPQAFLAGDLDLFFTFAIESSSIEIPS